jgi:hypothetical protein
MQTEAFGTVNTVVVGEISANDRNRRGIDGSLTGVSTAPRAALMTMCHIRWLPARHRVGWLLNDKMPTGVAVSGDESRGPYP